jgi:glutaminyl-peptide cyclotransferase
MNAGKEIQKPFAKRHRIPHAMKRALPLVVLLLVLAACMGSAGCTSASSPAGIPVYGYEVVRTYPHDRFAFTEGLSWDRGLLVESTGLRGNSTIRKVNLTTGVVNSIRHLPDAVFGEGSTVSGTKIVQETEDSGYGMIFDRETLEQLGTFNYTTEGWGITGDGQYLIMSDGTSSLYFRDPVTYRQVRRINVTAQGVPVSNLNELEYVRGEIYANIWPTERIARINPQTGEVVGWINLTGLLSAAGQEGVGWAEIASLQGHTSIPFEREACPNGIAYDPDGDRLFVTGKLWPELYEIRLVPS